jgi:hypothetical protein
MAFSQTFKFLKSFTPEPRLKDQMLTANCSVTNLTSPQLPRKFMTQKNLALMVP